MFNYQPLRNALHCVDKLLKEDRWFTGAQARACVIVEYTPEEEEVNLLTQISNFDMLNHVGPIVLCGIRFYRVDRLPDGDTWRVINVLGTL